MAIALTIVAVSVGGTVDSVTLQSPKSNFASVVSDGVAPGALIEANVTITLANNETLDRILVTHDGTSQCVDVGNATGGNNGTTVSRTVLFTARGVPGATDVAVRPYNSSNCSSNPVGNAKTTAFTVLSPAANVDFAGSCTSLNIVLVLDESGSITDNATYVTNVKSAATSFVNALNGTGANLKIVEFDEFATTPVDYTAVTAGNLATFTNYITNQYGSNSFHSTGAWTNWEDALEKANAGTKPDIVVFVTDGNPTAKDGETNFDDGDAEVLDLAFGRANELKDGAGDGKASHIYALGVGNALTQANAVTRLKGVSGNASGSNIATDDYSIVADFSNLQQTLKDLADQLCSREIKIVKQVDENGDGTYSEDPNVDFKFDVKVTTSAGDVKWLVPGPTNEASPSTKTVTINGSGESTLRFTGATPGATVSATVTEQTPPAGYEQVGSNCSFTTGQLAAGARLTCTIQNRRKVGTLIVKKVVINDNGGTMKATDFKFKLDGGAAVAFLQDGGNTLAGKNTLSVSAGSHSVVEDALPVAGYTTTYSNCADVTVANGGTQTCTITNDDQAGTIIVKKVVVNDEGGTKTAGDFSFKVGDAAPVAFVQDGQEPLKGEKSVSVSAGTHTVTEPAVDGYVASFENCSGIVVGNGETKTCTITNDDSIPPTVDVQKTVRVAGTEDAFAETASAPESSGTFEYRVVVWNKSVEAVSLTALTDTIGAVVTDLDGKGSCSVPQKLAGSDGSAGGADTYVCAFELTFSGNAGESQTDTVKATVRDDENDTATDEDNASVSLTDLKSSIEVTKTADPTTIDESLNGSDVTYTVVVKNTSAVDKVSLDTSGFVDRVKVNGDPATGVITAITNLDCNLESNQSDGLPVSLDPGESITCAFTMPVEGKAGDAVNDLITVTGRDDDGQSVSDSDDATVEITDVPSSITVTKTANPTVVQDSGPVTFTVVVRNDSAVDTVYITSLTDSIYGDLNGKGSCTLVDDVSAGPEGVSREILPGASYTCSFTATVTKTETDVVTASGVDDDGQPVKDDDDATVTVNHTPPPPYVPRTDITVTKAATPQVRLPQGGGTAPITYNLVVVNNGPDAAANVKVADTAPASVTFVSATTSGGSCTTAAQALDCTIASLAPGASIAITIRATVNATGTKTNVVVVTTATPETNTTNNTAQAQTLVTAPVTPPTAKPTPIPELCKALLVTPKMLKATGKSQKTNISVTRGKNGVAGVKVKLNGSGISKTVRTGKNGKVKLAIKPNQPGIIKAVIQGANACNSQRIGVVGVFEPPVTG